VPQFKRISPGAFPALKEALTTIYWYKSDLRSFLSSALSASPELLAGVDWSAVKRAIVGDLVDKMGSRESEYQGQILSLMSRIVEMPSFDHLAHLDDGPQKVERARSAVEALSEWISPHEEQMTELREAELRRRTQYEESLRNQAVRAKLDDLKMQFYELVSASTTPQRRGLLLEALLRDLFELFDLDPRASFHLQGEQIDGAFTFDNTDYLLEAKWTQDRMEPAQLDTFQGKINRKLDNTLGMFLSMNGFTDNAINLHSRSRPSMILWDGADLMAVLEGRVDLVHLLLRKRRHAAHTGEVFLPIHRVLVDE
jgi:hypothetical protein